MTGMDPWSFLNLLPVDVNCSLARIFFVSKWSIFSNVLAENWNCFLARRSVSLEGPKFCQFSFCGLLQASNRRQPDIFKGGLATPTVKGMVMWSNVTCLKSGFLFRTNKRFKLKFYGEWLCKTFFCFTV